MLAGLRAPVRYPGVPKPRAEARAPRPSCSFGPARCRATRRSPRAHSPPPPAAESPSGELLHGSAGLRSRWTQHAAGAESEHLRAEPRPGTSDGSTAELDKHGAGSRRNRHVRRRRTLPSWCAAGHHPSVPRPCRSCARPCILRDPVATSAHDSGGCSMPMRPCRYGRAPCRLPGALAHAGKAMEVEPACACLPCRPPSRGNQSGQCACTDTQGHVC